MEKPTNAEGSLSRIECTHLFAGQSVHDAERTATDAERGGDLAGNRMFDDERTAHDANHKHYPIG